MLLCYNGVDMCVFQVWRTRSACPSSACYSTSDWGWTWQAVWGWTRPVSSMTMTSGWDPWTPSRRPPPLPQCHRSVLLSSLLPPFSQDGAEIKYPHIHTFTTVLLSIRMVLRLSTHTFTTLLLSIRMVLRLKRQQGYIRSGAVRQPVRFKHLRGMERPVAPLLTRLSSDRGHNRVQNLALK